MPLDAYPDAASDLVVTEAEDLRGCNPNRGLKRKANVNTNTRDTASGQFSSPLRIL